MSGSEKIYKAHTKFAFAQRSGVMKAPVGLLSDRSVLRSKMEGPRPDKFQFIEQTNTILGKNDEKQ